MKKVLSYITLPALSLALLISCNGCNNSGNDSNGPNGPTGSETPLPVANVKVPEFDSDSAYLYVKQQVDFGPRMPNTPQHDACGKWLQQRFGEYADKVTVQTAKVTAFDNKALNCSNI